MLRVRMRQLTVCQPKVSVPTVGSHCDRMSLLATHRSAAVLQVAARSDCHRSYKWSLPLLSLPGAQAGPPMVRMRWLTFVTQSVSPAKARPPLTGCVA